MAIKVLFPAGESDVTVKGLYQWDYGQALEIECAEIGTEMLEVHFACHNMTEAVVRACYFESGVGTVEIPDECLEQTNAVTVWLCRSDATQRHTIKVITLLLTARTRPATVRDIPERYVDSYGQLLSEVSEAVGKLASGEVTAAKAKEAATAGHAATAGSASSATYATEAGRADSADEADKALYVKSALAFSCTITDGKGSMPDSVTNNAIYLVRMLETSSNIFHCGIFSGSASFDTQKFVMGTYLVTCEAQEEGDVTVTIHDGETVKGAGTMYFYIIGGLSQ